MNTYKISTKGFEKVQEAMDQKNIEYVNQKWENRPRSNILKWLMAKKDIDVSSMADILGLTVGSFNSKLARGSFSFDDILLAATACGFTLSFTDNKTKESYSIDPATYFEDYESERYTTAEIHMSQLAEKIMNELQERIEQMEQERKELESQMIELRSTSSNK